ncbi:hypothetical protein P280DRAFT_469548 [Massarina eburnea CBS 473.64]|uniref:ASX DEUBAD domain-containing protein n=1 Tax=Massarina eburnea CBS 473.64 TaxID=1395130 RepID=A0A6A6RZW0_9PLEO|nr:hypothetical protein P280DRAFT_469548 [Massarina eburnea CBS 473.64]
MALPVRSPRTSQDLLPISQPSNPSSFNPSTSNPIVDATPAANIATSHYQRRDTYPPQTPNSKSSKMCSPLQGSSPLSSPLSTIATPPTSWFGSNASKMVHEFAADPVKDSSSAQDLNGTTKAAAAAIGLQVPVSPRPTKSAKPMKSTKSTSSSKVKKRSYTETDEKPSPMKSKKPKKALRTPPPTTTSTRPSRSRKAPERFGDIPQTPKRAQNPRRVPATSKVFDPEYITTNPKSRLVKTDVYHLLLANDAWSSLTVPEKNILFSKIPKSNVNVRLLKQIENGEVADTVRPEDFQINFTVFRTDVAKFKQELEDGYLTKTWQAVSEQAAIDRADGMFDAWKADEYESWWGQKGSD